MIRIQGITFRHPRMEKPVLNDIDFSVEQGRIAVLLGPNGCGKTTLFKCIAGLWRPLSGRVWLDGRELSSLDHGERAKLLAVVPQDHVPPFPYSVLEAVLMGRAPHVGPYSLPSAHDSALALESLHSVGMSHLAERPYTRISGGERQMVLIARALAQDAPVLLLDEPTSHLDFRNQHHVLAMVRRVAEEKGLTVLMTLHDPNLAAGFAHQVIMLKNSGIMAEGEPEAVLTEECVGRLYDMNVAVLEHAGRRLIFPAVA